MQASAGALVSFTLIVGGIAELLKPAGASVEPSPPRLTEAWSGVDGGCSPGAIAPWTVHETSRVSTDARASALAVDESGVYWGIDSDGHDSSIVRATSATKRLLLASKQVQPSAIALDASSVYWISGREIRVVNKAGGAVRAIVVESTPISAFAVDDAGLYWIADGLLKRRAGGMPEATVAMTPAASSLSLDAHAAYVGTKHGIIKVSKTTRETTLLVEGEAPQLTQDRDHLYWADRGSVFRTSKDTGETSQVGPGSMCNTIDGLALDGDRIFLACGFGGGESLLMVPKVGGCPVSIRSNVELPATIKASGGALYWSENPGGGIVRIVP